MEAIAKTKYLKGSPRKARLVVDLIRGRNVSQALAILKFTDKRAADPIAKCLNSAIANATYQAEQQNIAIDPDDLWVKTCFVDMGPTKNRRRMRPAPQGRAYREQRHYCHITIQVTSDEAPKTEKESKAEAAKAKKAAAAPKIEKKKAAPKAKKETKKVRAEEVGTPAESAEEQDAKITAEAADAKDTETQTAAAIDETAPADEKQQDTNEELER
jgi:large subunit ribosomal protein L22